MKTLFFFPAGKGRSNRYLCREILAAVSTLLPPGEIEICHSLRDLDGLLQRSGWQYAGAVLDATCRGELESLVARREFLRDLKTVLIAPPVLGEKASFVHLLRPRLVVCSRAEVAGAALLVQRIMRSARWPCGRPGSFGPCLSTRSRLPLSRARQRAWPP